MFERVPLNDNWLYIENFCEVMKEEEYDESRMSSVRLPHTNIELPFHYFDEGVYQFVSCYRRKIYGERSYLGKHVFITFEGVAHIAKIYMHGKLIGEHKGGYTAFTIDISPYLHLGEYNTLVVEVDSRESNNIPPFGHVIDYMTYGGIYREVFLEVKESIYIDDVFIQTKEVRNETKKLQVEVTVKQSLDKAGEAPWNQHNLEGSSVKLLLQREGCKDGMHELGNYTLKGETTTIELRVSDVELWEIERPVLYILYVELEIDNERVDGKWIRFGFRESEFRKDGFYLNGEKIKLLGLNRHQSYPYVGYAMPRRAQQTDADILKRELGVNAVRTSHYPQSQHFINRCDELGLLVFTEIPGWQHIGDSQWKEAAIQNTREMILQYRNHPSIVLWGVRINESQDDDEFYNKTNRIAHELDPSRQTGGVRFLKNSNLLEDVYTYNDFSHNGCTEGLEPKKSVTSNMGASYLVSEFNGHMFPTKPFDSEEHRLNHAKRHAAVLNSLYQYNDIAGGFGWCMFDYNTHKDFGSGDRICYHGVLTMFRNHKLAASVYGSQLGSSPVCEISSSMDIGEHPACNLSNVMAFTNSDSIKLYKNDEFVKEFYPDTKKYSSLPHPPIVIDDFVGELIERKEGYCHSSAETIKKVLFAIRDNGQNHLPLHLKIKMALVMLKEKLSFQEGLQLYYKYIGNWGGEAISYRFDAIQNGVSVKSIVKKPVSKPAFKVITDTNTLSEEGTYDVASIRILAVDENGEKLPYFQEVVELITTGPIEIIGPKKISLKGGSFGTYVKTIGKVGEASLSLCSESLDKVTIDFTII
ncbi:glycoside hydrolase family 2 protein [Anaeromicropila populeti]|uniref:Beta-galactosidase n=1 Tax=Anaeromicropila populeti TaxID=37658 RepID=A0A1I6IPQ1_9FIRM|nr:glycoside hydrolase family 2 TIM barrel-domain containing protein [Anaeromicropila populeti]SFR68220.1 beta-galactosidase [Anaeromicropila populeti]